MAQKRFAARAHHQQVGIAGISPLADGFERAAHHHHAFGGDALVAPGIFQHLPQGQPRIVLQAPLDGGNAVPKQADQAVDRVQLESVHDHVVRPGLGGDAEAAIHRVMRRRRQVGGGQHACQWFHVASSSEKRASPRKRERSRR
jgi:hypothetical protein